jgi:hypothetical protein
MWGGNDLEETCEKISRKLKKEGWGVASGARERVALS